MNILIFNEGIHDKEENIKAVYPNGIHGALKELMEEEKHNVTVTTLDDVEEVITEELLKDIDVIIWWGHIGHHLVPQTVVDMVVKAVHCGAGFIALHSAHFSRPFKALTGSACTLEWRDDERERLWVAAPYHPITQGLPKKIEIEHEEMYSEPFDIPNPDEIIFIGWFAGGEVFRSGCTFHRGAGKIFYFQPGHEEYPTYFNPHVRQILKNAANWAKRTVYREGIVAPHSLTPAEAERN